MDDKGNVILNQPMAIGRDAQAGPGSIAIGAGAKAGSPTLGDLAQELFKLHSEMKSHAKSAGQHEAIIQVLAAAEAAKENDSLSVMSHLKAAGKWAFDFASRVGSSLAATAIAKAMGA
jgi:hypothetical protein